MTQTTDLSNPVLSSLTGSASARNLAQGLLLPYPFNWKCWGLNLRAFTYEARAPPLS